ncbi:amidohydrolase family protein [Mycolicibacterium sp. CBMA 226]|uniref:amidohydrolase family protein n=1 Tax=Mycolicibacterium sp. CBMA 226 TaxID=2606611 RepID=UPI0012DCA8C5|nr:amidohydrolase family protein [Mycolicibacterium sp. CBMA 226]MUL77128.1 amidohydrolase family protein [Mycolicibacterium sp. CBMA 226]
MKIIALEEHFATAAIIEAWQQISADIRDPAVEMSARGEVQRLLLDLTDERIAYMDATGIDAQVLSVTTAGVQNIDPATAVPLARAANDLIAATIRSHPDRFQGFATLPTSDPRAAAAELERATVELGLNGAMIFGRTGDRNLDHPDFLPLLQTANDLRAPLYLHPQSPTPSVRRAYYEHFPHELATMFATGGIGWHYETGVQALRLIVSGLLDRLPDLPVILGHWGEVVLFYLDRIDVMSAPAGLPRPISEYLTRNFWVTPSGIMSQRYLRWALEVVGAERIMFSTDYPFARLPDNAAPQFLTDAGLTDTDRQAIASGNWNQLCARIRRQL